VETSIHWFRIWTTEKKRMEHLWFGPQKGLYSVVCVAIPKRWNCVFRINDVSCFPHIRFSIFRSFWGLLETSFLGPHFSGFMLVNQRLCNSVQPEPEVDGLHLASSIPVYWLQHAPFFPWWMVHTHTWSSWNVNLFCSGDVCVCMYNMLMDVHVYLCIIYIYIYLGTYNT